jgi:hypothetical protein
MVFEKDQCYFLVTHFDHDCRLPSVETYVFVGKNILGETAAASSDDRWYFQSGELRAQSGLFDRSRHIPAEHLIVIGEDMIDEFVDIRGLIDRLEQLAKPKN